MYEWRHFSRWHGCSPVITRDRQEQQTLFCISCSKNLRSLGKHGASCNWITRQWEQTVVGASSRRWLFRSFLRHHWQWKVRSSKYSESSKEFLERSKIYCLLILVQSKTPRRSRKRKGRKEGEKWEEQGSGSRSSVHGRRGSLKEGRVGSRSPSGLRRKCVLSWIRGCFIYLVTRSALPRVLMTTSVWAATAGAGSCTCVSNCV